MICFLLNQTLKVVACLSLKTCDGRPNRHPRYGNKFEREQHFRKNWNKSHFSSFEHNHNPYSGRLTEPNESPIIWPPHAQKLPQVWSPKEVMTSPPTEFPEVPNAGYEMPLKSMASDTMYNLWLTSRYLRLMAANALQNMNSFNNFGAKPMNRFNQQMSSGLSSGTQLESAVSPLLAFFNKIIEQRLNHNLSLLNQDSAEKEDEVEVTLETPQLLSSTEGIESQIHTNHSIENTTPQEKVNDNGHVGDDSEMQIEDVTEEFEEDNENEVSGEDLLQQQLLQGTNNNQAEILKTQGQQEKINNNEHLDDDTEIQVEDVSEEVEEDDENEYSKEDQLKQQLPEINKNQTELLKTQNKQVKIYQAKDLDNINTSPTSATSKPKSNLTTNTIIV